jgi:RimJ/RimL family protein N-acetyltransferase
MSTMQINPVPASKYKRFKETQDKQGNSIWLFQNDLIEFTPAFLPIWKAWIEVYEKGWAIQRIHFGNNTSVMWAERPNGKFCGAINYRWISDDKAIWILMTTTEDDERGKGINTVLQEEVERRGKEKHGATNVGSTIHAENIAALRSAEKMGRLPIFYRTHKEL